MLKTNVTHFPHRKPLPKQLGVVRERMTNGGTYHSEIRPFESLAQRLFVATSYYWPSRKNAQDLEVIRKQQAARRIFNSATIKHTRPIIMDLAEKILSLRARHPVKETKTKAGLPSRFQELGASIISNLVKGTSCEHDPRWSEICRAERLVEEIDCLYTGDRKYAGYSPISYRDTLGTHFPQMAIRLVQWHQARIELLHLIKSTNSSYHESLGLKVVDNSWVPKKPRTFSPLMLEADARMNLSNFMILVGFDLGTRAVRRENSSFPEYADQWGRCPKARRVQEAWLDASVRFMGQILEPLPLRRRVAHATA